MLAGIFGRKSDHPLADIKSAQALLENLPRNDAYKSLIELTEWIEALAESIDFKVDHQLEVLRLLDEAAQPHSRKLIREYFTPFEMNKFQENRLWLALGNFSRHTALAYYMVFTRYCNADKGSAAIKAHIPLLVARSLNATTSQLKYICAHYGQIDKVIWANIAHLYKHAEQLQYLNTPIKLYSGAPATSVKCEAARLLVWFDKGLLALSPLYMHLTERLVAQYCATIEISPEVSGNSRLSFDLNQTSEPTRINMGATTHHAMRFISMPTMQAKLEELMKVLNKNIIPEDLNLGGSYEPEIVREAVRYLLAYLIAPPVRRNVRHAANVTLNVITSFDEVIQRSKADMSAYDEPTAHWVTEEISVSGFSSILPSGSNNIGIGSLLGIQPDGVIHWGVAVVRRLLRDDANQLRAGAEIIANQVAVVLLNQNGNEPRNGNELENRHAALWLFAKQGESDSGTQLLLMPTDSFVGNRSLKIQLEGKNYLLIPIGLQEKGLDYDLAKFKLIEQDDDD
jgi:hypothetical protein